jgi:hypothetical protein
MAINPETGRFQREFPSPSGGSFSQNLGMPNPSSPSPSSSVTGGSPNACSEAYGAGWTGTYPNCTYSPSGIGGQQPWENLQPGDESFTGDVDYGEEFKGTTHEDDWRRYFDPYDPEEEEMLTRAWDIQGRQLGDVWGLKGKGLRATASRGLGQVGRAGSTAIGKSDLAFSGTIADIERQKRGEVTGAYEQSFGLGKTAYEQAMISGGLKLEADVYGLRKDWRKEQRDTLNVLLAGDIYEDGDIVDDPNKPQPGEAGGPENQGRMRSCEAQGGRWDNYTKTCDTS